MKRIISIPGAPQPLGPYSQAVLSENTLYISGQLHLDPMTSEMCKGSIQDKTHMVMKNILMLLNEAGMDFSNVVKSSIFLSDMNNFAEVNEVYASYFKPPYPARETIQVARLPKDADVEISMIAVK